MKRVGLSRFRLVSAGRAAAPGPSPVRPSLLEPQGFRVPAKERHPEPALPVSLKKTAPGPVPGR